MTKKIDTWDILTSSNLNITDGFNVWSKTCSHCGKDTVQVVRPGCALCVDCYPNAFKVKNESSV